MDEVWGLTIDEARVAYLAKTQIKAKSQLDNIEASSFSYLDDKTRKAIIKELKEKLEIGTLGVGASRPAEGKPVSLDSLAKILGGKSE